MLLDFGKLTKVHVIPGIFHFISPATVISTLIHYTCTVVLPGLADWSAILVQVLLTMRSHDWDNGAHGGY